MISEERDILAWFRAIVNGEDLILARTADRIREFVSFKGGLSEKEELTYAHYCWRRRSKPNRLARSIGDFTRKLLEQRFVVQRPLGWPSLSRKVSQLVGLRLSELRQPGCQVFEFGEQRLRAAKFRDDCPRGDFQLTVGTSWSIFKDEEVVFGSEDHLKTERFYDRSTPPADLSEQKRWHRARMFFDECDNPGLVVSEVLVGPGGCLQIGLTKGYSLIVVPTTSSSEYDHWDLWHVRRNMLYAVGSEQIEITVTRLRSEPAKEPGRLVEGEQNLSAP